MLHHLGAIYCSYNDFHVFMSIIIVPHYAFVFWGCLCSSGKIAVIGGCREYTGAPYFAAITALKIVSAPFPFSLIL